MKRTGRLFDSLLALWRRRFKDPRLSTLIAAIVRCYRNATAKGLPIGSLTSQHLANFYLGWLDRFVKAHSLQTLSDREFQNHATSLVSFLKTEGMSSWHFRKRTLYQDW